jgi:DNA-binding CsgD family transcriptional regulator
MPSAAAGPVALSFACIVLSFVVAALLSPTEGRVMQELGNGYSNKVIARRIDVSESTVRFHPATSSQR